MLREQKTAKSMLILKNLIKEQNISGLEFMKRANGIIIDTPKGV